MIGRHSRVDVWRELVVRDRRTLSVEWTAYLARLRRSITQKKIKKSTFKGLFRARYTRIPRIRRQTCDISLFARTLRVVAECSSRSTESFARR